MLARVPVYESVGKTLTAWAVLAVVGLIGLGLLVLLDRRLKKR